MPIDAQKLTAVDFSHSSNFVPLLQQLGVSLLVSTYQAGRVLVIGQHQGSLQIRFHHFEQAMGMARTPTGLTIGSKQQIWFLDAAPDLAPRVQPQGMYDCAFLTRRSHFTGSIMGHDLAWSAGELWVANTGFSCLAVIDPKFSFVPRWQPSFISALAAEDRCHLNGLATDDGGPRYVTALAETNTAAGWRADKANTGCVIDVKTSQVILRGLCMPHSPRLYRDQLYVLNSGRGQLDRIDRNRGQVDMIAQVPGYTRGLDCYAGHAFVGLSRIRETSVFGGLPIAEQKANLCCGVAMVDLARGQNIASLRFLTGVEEIFDVKVLPGFQNPILSGPFPDVDQTETLWLVPGAPA